MNKSWSKSSNRINCRFNFPGGPFILKLIPNNPSPTSFGIIISPISGIFEINLFKFFAGTRVPLKLVTAFFLIPSSKTDILGPKANYFIYSS